MSVIRMENVTKKYENTLIFRDIYFRVSKGERIGLIGRNGAGKSTVFKLIMGKEEPTAGKVELDPNVKISYFSQFSELSGSLSVQQELELCFEEVARIEQELNQIGEQLGQVSDDVQMNALLERQAELFEQMEHLDGWNVSVEINTVLTKLGFDERSRHQPVEELSGGWRNRAALAKVLIEAPDVVLLDEPTNFLDMEGIVWLEQWLHRFNGAMLLVSHDRQFIDRVVTRTIEIENYHFQEYEGNYTDYVRKKKMRKKVLDRQFEWEEELLLMESEAIENRGSKKSSKDRLSRKLTDMKKRVEPHPVNVLITDIYSNLRFPDKLGEVKRIGQSYDGRSIFQNISFDIQKEDRIAIVGPNGSGKSTLIKVLTGQEAPESGEVTWERGVGYAYFNQMWDELDHKDTVSHAVNVYGLGLDAPRKKVNKFLAMLQFSEMDLSKTIGSLSGGQQARVALAKCLLSGAAVIILDEPTNHLDLTSIQVMEQALIHFPGAVVTVSHDRFFIDKIATKMLTFDPELGITEQNV
ncbi:ABC-F family ATP-binding cassette domain-containing protein [Paenibacillus sp. FSL R7-0048]|uniref:ABC-F family ATP-binding cassette domain-containing protein n=1 Tax=Paenibacillus TaxID=44249 RepID=UPI00096F7043|nr:MULTISPECIES: ABC-F family ATP-binding cassette domain-containing protein [Paenibacillus]MDH6426953.1 ATPase subunit of ABC transporter with duplicated ATPase domains [Paenibacillus sp. PastH-4]MDH6442981.1 ATPase subunit of ABC transporter with duplicated ATPase domains [Paenibacillus sp. PastF-4]MDH6526311.1 ATPase subunit of ABC transporter with duplicated ATPase domains [Paenibacillus sp. PastH-3]OMC73808.1 ABC transporter [Paenibacillus odorifer]OMD60978.1 ABC transporter [Paenibacillu